MRIVVGYETIALIQLEGAIDFYRGGNYICAVTLAGAAEEVLGSLLKTREKPCIFDELLEDEDIEKIETDRKARSEILNLSRNGFKHMKEIICGQEIDVELEARNMIVRASINFCRFTEKKTEKISDFIAHIY